MLYVEFRKLAFMTYGTRLNQALTAAQLSRAALAKHLGMSVQAVGQAIRGGRSGDQTFTASNNVKAAQFLKVNAHWLATGEGVPATVKEWPGKKFTLEQIHTWPQELIAKVEDYAEGYLAALENPRTTVQKSSNNRFTVDEDGNLSKKLPAESKQGKSDGSSNPIPPRRQAEG